MKDIAACTIISKNYLAFARVLTESYLKYNPDSEFFVLLVDKVDGFFDPEKERFYMVRISELDIPDINRFIFQYNVIELNTAVKPYFLQHLFKTYAFKKILYLDPDILVLKSLSKLFNLLDQYSIILTPHIISTIMDDYKPNEIDILGVGTFNLGFIGLRNTDITQRMLKWWGDKLYSGCKHAVGKGFFVDQKWVDLVPCIFEGVYIIRNQGYNVAYWNLPNYIVKNENNEYTVNGKSLYFFHFSGMEMQNLKSVSKYQNRYTMKMIENIRPLFKYYRDMVFSKGYADSSNWPYAFGKFDNGVIITESQRLLYFEMGNNVKVFGNPFETKSSGSYFSWLKKRKRQKISRIEEPLFMLICVLFDLMPRFMREFLNTTIEILVNLLRKILGPINYERLIGKMELRRGSPVPDDTSETSKCRVRLAKYCTGYGLDIGYGGDPITPSAITMDMPKPYTRVGDHPLNLGGDAKDIYWFKDNVLDYVYSSHLLEDFENTEELIREWLRILKPDGYLVLYLPDEQVYKKHCQETGQEYNAAHKIPNFGLNYLKNILKNFKGIEVVYENPLVENYSFEIVIKKIGEKGYSV